jgi:hypothetical protein
VDVGPTGGGVVGGVDEAQESYELWNADLEVACCDQVCPEDGHDGPSPNVAVSNQLGAESEPMAMVTNY